MIQPDKLRVAIYYFACGFLAGQLRLHTHTQIMQHLLLSHRSSRYRNALMFSFIRTSPASFFTHTCFKLTAPDTYQYHQYLTHRPPIRSILFLCNNRRKVTSAYGFDISCVMMFNTQKHRGLFFHFVINFVQTIIWFLLMVNTQVAETRVVILFNRHIYSLCYGGCLFN